MYIDKIFPFFHDSDFIRSTKEKVNIRDIYCPLDFQKTEEVSNTEIQKRNFNLYRILPCNTLVLNEKESVIYDIISGVYGDTVNVIVSELDYSTIAKRVQIDNVDNGLSATLYINDGYEKEDIATDAFISACANGVKVDEDLIKDVKIESTSGVDFDTWINSMKVNESADMLSSLLSDAENSGGDNPYGDASVEGNNKDSVYKWLDAYFALPEEQDMKNSGREVVPLLIGPTAVFKSATVKELCKKYNYRMVDFRVSFTSRLDYSGLFNIGEVDGNKYSYSCPMEELVTCSDGFREYCREAYDKVTDILTKGYIEENKVSDGETTDSKQTPLTEEQRIRLQKLLDQYKNYMRTPVLFFDEITRTKDKGVEGILVQLLNQKRFNNMTMNGCKFVAATNLNLPVDQEHIEYKSDLDDLYDVDTDIDVAYANRFMPLEVYPKDVEDRWFEWAKTEKTRGNKQVQSIHEVVYDFLKSSKGKNLVYNDSPVLEDIRDGLSENEIRSQTFPNYRTWEMVSDYLYSVDDDYNFRVKSGEKNAVKEYRDTTINGLISTKAGEPFMEYLDSLGYKKYTEVHGVVSDDVGDFLESNLSAGVPAMLIGPSSLGKTSRVHQYMNKVKARTGLEPVLININLASMDTTDLMGMPVKQSLTDYVSGGDLSKLGLTEVGKELKDIVKKVSSNGSYGMTDTMTLRAPDMTKKEMFSKALNEGREVILLFDECNRCTNPTVMSAMFECISDKRCFGISFKNYADQVKIIACCNMSYEGLDDNSDGYGDAQALDPALAARFSIYWKKQYDENDVKSWIDFMEGEKKKGTIDPTVLEYFKTLSTEDAIKLMSQVEKRTLENATPSTRTLYQLSKDIKSMRGRRTANGYKESLYNGKVIFDDMTTQQVTQVNEVQQDVHYGNTSVEEYIQKVDNLLENSILLYKDNWEPAITGKRVDLGKDKEITCIDLMDNLQAIHDFLHPNLVKSLSEKEKKECEIYADTAMNLIDVAMKADTDIKNQRAKQFEKYCGYSFSTQFANYFNSVFGTEEDEDITIDMLSDDSLINPFMRQQKLNLVKYSGNTDKMIDAMLGLMKDFLNIHGTSLPPKNYADFISGIENILPTSDNMNTLIKRSDKDVENLYMMGEKTGDAWIESILRSTSTPISEQDIQNMREQMTKKGNSSGSKRTRIL